MLLINVDAFLSRANELRDEITQLPFALSQSMNDAAETTRQALITETWPNSVTVRNPSFLNAALTRRNAYATRDNLHVVIYDKLQRASLPLHADGGVKRPKGRALAIPLSGARRGGKGAIVRSDRPRNIAKAVVKDGVIYRETGQGKRKRLKPMYALKPTAKINKDVPFREDFARVMALALRESLPVRMARALATRKR